MANRRLFRPVSKDVVPWGVLEANAATGEHAGGAAVTAWGRPSILVNGISVALEEEETLKIAGIGFPLVEPLTSTVIAPGGRIDEPTTSARNRFRVPCAVARDVSM